MCVCILGTRGHPSSSPEPMGSILCKYRPKTVRMGQVRVMFCDFVCVSGKSKGRGFSGTIKKYSFSTQRKTHGQGDTHRHVGSIGAASDPSRVFPGKKMPGRYGNKNVSVKDLEVISVNESRNQLLVKGSVPGATNGIVYITR